MPTVSYQGAETLNTTGLGQTFNVVTFEGDIKTMKSKYENLHTGSGKIRISAVDSGVPNFRVRYFVGDKNITGLMETTGKTFKHIDPGESTKAPAVEVKAKSGSSGSPRTVFLDGELIGNVYDCAPDRVGVVVDLT